MNILHRVTQRLLRKNPTRTWVTIIGITLSMALFVAVLEGAYSGLMFLLNMEGTTDGYYQAYYYGLDETQAKQAAEQSAVKDSTTWQLVGYEAVESLEENRRPICVDAIGEDPNGLLAVKLFDGRMPQSENELLLPYSYYISGDLITKEIREIAHAAIGTELTLPLGLRTDKEGKPLTEGDYYLGIHDEIVTDVTEHSYTIVGVYQDFDTFIERDRGFYRALTVGQGIGEYRVFFTLKLPTFYNIFAKTQTVSKHLAKHSSILRYYGASDNTLVVALYGIAGVLVALVAFGSISLIYNSFSISVAERTRQFGILRSIGATTKQIRSMVRYEAFVLGLAGTVIGAIVGLVGIGITLWGISPMLSRMLSSESVQTGVQMQLVFNPFMLLLSAIVCLLTTLISASIPAKRAVRINAIDAIRQTNDMHISPREVRVSRLTGKLFGFEGMMASKSFKRNRKRYRATVLSLFLSIVLFVSASSLTSYLKDSVNAAVGDTNKVDVCVYSYDDGMDTDKVFTMLREAETVTAGTYSASILLPLTLDMMDLTESYKSLQEFGPERTTVQLDKSVQFVDDETFRSIAKSNGYKPDMFFTGDPQGLIINQSTDRVYVDGKAVYKTTELVDTKAFPVLVTAKDDCHEKIEGWVMLSWDGILPNEALKALGVGENETVLYDEEAFARLNRADESGNSPLGDALRAYDQTGTFDISILDPAKLRIVPESELYISYTLTVAGACVVNEPIVVSSGSILYPYSRLADVFAEETVEKVLRAPVYCFRANDHTVASASLKSLAEQAGMRAFTVHDLAESFEIERMLVTIVNIFAYGFIILISLIAVANVFNTISTNVLLRRREFAMLKSIGLSEKGFGRMLNYECVIYGLKGLLWGLPAAVLVTFLIWNIASNAVEQGFYIPWHSVVIAVGSVFAVVFATMLYAKEKIRRDNPIDALKNETL